jgi:hypothetical protein
MWLGFALLRPLTGKSPCSVAALSLSSTVFCTGNAVVGTRTHGFHGDGRIRKFVRPAPCGSLYLCSFRPARCVAVGVSPITSLYRRVKWAWSAKPSSVAKSAKLIDGFAKSDAAAFCMRRHSINHLRDMPVCRLTKRSSERFDIGNRSAMSFVLVRSVRSWIASQTRFAIRPIDRRCAIVAG